MIFTNRIVKLVLSAPECWPVTEFGNKIGSGKNGIPVIVQWQLLHFNDQPNTYFSEKLCVFQASWFPRIAALGILSAAMLLTSLTFSLPKSPGQRKPEEDD